MKILIVKNYAPDAQFSMLAFADMLARELPKQGCEVAIAEPPVCFGKNQITHTGLGKWRGYFDKYILAKGHLQKAERKHQPDIVHVCDHSNATYLPLFQARQLITCHDLLAIRIWRGEIPGQSKSPIGARQQQWIWHHLRQTNHIACVSEKTRQDLFRFAPETEKRSRVIAMGLNYPYQRISDEEAQRRMHELAPTTLSGEPLCGTFVLHVGNDAWYKNRLGALRIWKRARKQIKVQPKIVFVGDPPSEDMATELQGLESQAAFVSSISIEQLEALYCKATCLLFPSLAEGYGWPPIEAQACGCPAVVSNIEPLRSNCEGALVIETNEEEAAANCLADLLNSTEQQDALRRKGLLNAQRFTAEKMAFQYIAYYHKILKTS